MTYQNAIDYLFSQLPMFTRVGAAAYKPGLERTLQLAEVYDHPERKFKAIHIAGTNGKGSTSHMLASVLQATGYKTALYTSPHLVDFRERIRINGEMIPQEDVVKFVENLKSNETLQEIRPSFFELTMMLAFDWFAREKVDYAVIEVGMGGRLDSTNIISPLASVITNISFDHTQFLGDTLAKIASEKAGIMKPGIPVVIGEAVSETETVFRNHASEVGATLREAYSNNLITSFEENPDWGWDVQSPIGGRFHLPLAGDYQRKNLNTLLSTLDILRLQGIKIDDHDIRCGLEGVEQLTGLSGRWTRLNQNPLVICDTGHNEGGLRYNLAQLARLKQKRDGELRIVMGFVADKDVRHILPMFPKDAIYYITNANIPRAMKAEELATLCHEANLDTRHPLTIIPDVKQAYAAALSASSPTDLIYIGGSTFVVADLLTHT